MMQLIEFKIRGLKRRKSLFSSNVLVMRFPSTPWNAKPLKKHALYMLQFSLISQPATPRLFSLCSEFSFNVLPIFFRWLSCQKRLKIVKQSIHHGMKVVTLQHLLFSWGSPLRFVSFSRSSVSIQYSESLESFFRAKWLIAINLLKNHPYQETGEWRISHRNKFLFLLTVYWWMGKPKRWEMCLDRRRLESPSSNHVR